MKQLLLFLGTAAALLINNASVQAQDLTNPGEYMTAISKAHQEMNQKYMAYMSAAAHGRRARKVEKLRQQVLESIENSRYKTIDLPIYKGDNSLRQSSLDYIKLCYSVFNEDYNKIVNMEEIAEQSFDEMQAYILLQEKTSEKIKEASDKMNQASKAFATKYNVTVIEDKSELGQKLEVAGKLNHYLDQVYLVFFKCNWQEARITEALNAKKVNDAEQGRAALLRYADEGMKALDTLRSFEGDAALASTCRTALQFYKKTAEKVLPTLTDFYLKQENFEKIKKVLEAKPESSRTKQDVDAFNKSVNEINAATNVYNNTNNELNQNRHQVLEDWDKTYASFTDQHMPQYKG